MSWTMEGMASVLVDASPEKVYALVSDITRMGEWSPECVGCEWTNGATGPAVGATFHGHNKRGENEWTTPNTVLVAEPGREFSWVVGSPQVRVCAWGFRLEPAVTGTKATQFFELGDVPVGFRQMVQDTPEPRREAMIEARRRQLVEDIEATLRTVKAAAEGE